MSGTSASDDRLLKMPERELVDMTHLPAIDELSETELQAIAKRLRAMRDRAQRIARQQQREIRGKAEPRGATAARDNAGSVGKSEVLAEALRRVSAALRKRRAPTQAQIAKKLMAQKRANAANATGHHPGPGRTASAGMKAKTSSKPTVTMDPREVGRVSQAGKSAQAKRDRG